MNGREKIAVERLVYILIIGLLILSLFPLYAFFRFDASFGAWLEPVTAEESGTPDRALPPVPEPASCGELPDGSDGEASAAAERESVLVFPGGETPSPES